MTPEEENFQEALADLQRRVEKLEAAFERLPSRQVAARYLSGQWLRRAGDGYPQLTKK